MDFNDSADGVAARPAPLPDSGLGRDWFQRPNPAGGVQGTTVQADFLNDVAGSLVELVTAAGLVPARGNDDQVRLAVQTLAAALVNAHAIQLSTYGVAGHLEVATAGEVRDMALAARVVSPQELPGAFRTGEQASSTDAWDATAGSFMGRWLQHPTERRASALDFPLVVTEQWGVTPQQSFGTPQTVTFPIPFAGTNYSISGWFLSPPFTGPATGGLPSSCQLGNIQAASFDVESASAPDERFMWRAVGLAALQA